MSATRNTAITGESARSICKGRVAADDRAVLFGALDLRRDGKIRFLPGMCMSRGDWACVRQIS